MKTTPGIQKAWHQLKKWRLRNLPARPYAQDYQYQHVACVIVNNEADILEEWVLFHLTVGIEHFIIWDHQSSDVSRKVLEPYEKAGLVHWMDFPYDTFNVARQIKIYNKTIAQLQGKAKWIWFLDSDEFVVPATADTIPELIDPIESDPEVGAIAVNWLFFGTSEVESLAPGEWHIEKLTQRAPEEWKNHRATKGALRPEATAGFMDQPHFPILRQGKKIVYPDRTDFDDKHTTFDILRVHHYWHRTESFYRNRKIARKEYLSGRKRSQHELNRLHQLYNQVNDNTLKRFIPRMVALRKELSHH